ncbi:hypothetical protein NC652_027776 [Populus alba x Populus x berolinensis]|nr:hypothetical protein NC652_027776 [Populus alba x Populus x berolinensis]
MICIGQKHFQKALELLHNAFSLLNESPRIQTMVAALASDPNVWNAVWENKALQELLQSQNANKEYVADNESVGDTDSQDAAVSSKKLTELSDDENETGNSQTGLMDVINNVKLTVVDMVTNVSAYFKKIFSFSSAEHTPDAADEKAGSSTTEKTLGASLMALAVMVAEVNGEYVVCLVISSRGVQNNIDILSLSYTRHAEDVRHILQEADGVILSRGNLGIDLPPEKNLRPPRAEATDVANAILDASYTSESIILLLIAVLIPHSSSLVVMQFF